MKPDSTGRRIDNSYADLVVARRSAQRREWTERRYGTLGPASEVRRIDPGQYHAGQEQPEHGSPRRTAPDGHNSDCGTRSPQRTEKRKQG